MAKTTNEMIRTYLPLFILVGTIIAGWVRLQSGLEAVTQALEKHSIESRAQESVTDAALTALEDDGDVTDIHIAEMKKDMEYLRKDVEALLAEQRSATTAILAKLKEALNE